MSHIRISRSWVPLINKSQKFVGAPVSNLKNRGCVAFSAPTLKRPLLDPNGTYLFLRDKVSNFFWIYNWRISVQTGTKCLVKIDKRVVPHVGWNFSLYI